MVRHRHFARAAVGWAALLFVLSLVALPAQAQYFGRNKVTYDRFDFERIQTEHFDVY